MALASPASLGGGHGFLIPAASILPTTDPVYLGAPQVVKDQLELLAAGEILKEKRQALLLGEGASGGKLEPIHALTKLARDRNINPTVPPRGRKPYSPMGRASSAYAPLVATGPNARAIQLLRVAPVAGGLWVYWNRDPHSGKYWGEVLGLHRTGHTVTMYWPRRKRPIQARIPRRDTIGMSGARIGRVKNVVDARWRRMRPSIQKTQELAGIDAGTARDRRYDLPRTSDVPATPVGASGRRDVGGLQGLVGGIVARIGNLFRGR